MLPKKNKTGFCGPRDRPSIDALDVAIKDAIEDMAMQPGDKGFNWNSLATAPGLGAWNKTGKQVSERWSNYLDPTLRRGPWLDEEIEQLFDLAKECGNQWTQIGRKMGNRSANDCKNTFYTRRKKRGMNAVRVTSYEEEQEESGGQTTGRTPAPKRQRLSRNENLYTRAKPTATVEVLPKPQLASNRRRGRPCKVSSPLLSPALGSTPVPVAQAAGVEVNMWSETTLQELPTTPMVTSKPALASPVRISYSPACISNSPVGTGAVAPPTLSWDDYFAAVAPATNQAIESTS